MPELRFNVSGTTDALSASAPAVELTLEISNHPASQQIQTIVLRSQVQIETPRRTYTQAEKGALRDLFGEPERWRQTLRRLLWNNVSLVVPAFAGQIAIPCPLPCTFDFNLSTTKFFYGLEGGEIPLTLMFSGTVFYRSDSGALQAAPIPWSSEARFDFPVAIWKRCLDSHCPYTAIMPLRRDVFDRLYRFKIARGLATFDEAIDEAIGSFESAGVS